MNSLIPSNLRNDQLLEIEREAKDFALINGISFRVKESQSDDHLVLAPITLFPSPFSRKHFNTAKHIQPSINELMHKVAYDQTFITQSLEKVITVDDFTEKLYRIYDKVMRDGLTQNTSLGLFRSDYMMHQHLNDDIDMKQVEVNAISVSFGGLGPRIRDLHMYIMSKYNPIDDLKDHLPPNDASRSLAEGLIKSWEKYNCADSVILFVVERRAINICDQRILQFTLGQLRPDIRVIRKSFAKLRGNLRLIANRQLILNDKHEIGVIYFRTGYGPNDYQNQDDWNLRLMMEQSLAIKCPSIQYHLSGTKKIQQILSDVNVLEKFISNEHEVNDVMKTFTGLWGLELNDSGNSAVEMALKDPKRFVLKPQREGGGNNYYGSDIVSKLSEIRDHKEREAYILMEFIRQPQVANYILGPNQSISESNFEPVNVVCELGIFGAIIGNHNEIFHNTSAGHVLRSKASGVNEGGIAAGFGAIDSPFLI